MARRPITSPALRPGLVPASPAKAPAPDAAGPRVAPGTREQILTGYVVAVQIAAAALIALMPGTGIGDRPVAALLLVGMAALAGSRPVRLPALRVNLNASHPFVFTAMATVGPLAAVLADLAGIMGAALGRRSPPHTRHFLFNVGAAVVGTYAAWGVFTALGGTPDSGLPEVMGPVFAAATTYFLLNSALVTVAISLEQRIGFLATWRRSCLWTSVPFFAGLTFAVAMIGLIEVMIPWGILLAVAPTWLLLGVYRSHPESLGLPRRRGDARDVASAGPEDGHVPGRDSTGP